MYIRSTPTESGAANGLSRPGSHGGVTASDGKVYVMDRQTGPKEAERVLCFDEKSGKLLWEHRWPVTYGSLDYGNGPRASVTIHQGRALVLGALVLNTPLRHLVKLTLPSAEREPEWQ